MLLFSALRFAVAQNRPLAEQGSASADQTVVLETPLGPHEAWCYRPRHRPRGTVVTVPGLSPLGIQDPRWIKLNQGLRDAGFSVVAPRFPDLQDLRVSATLIDQIEAVLASIVDNPALGSPQKIAVFSVSFSGALSLQAATRPSLAGRVSALFALGTYCDIRTALGRIMLDEAVDPYGRLVLMGNFLEASIGPQPAVAAACFTLALQNWRAEPPAALDATLAALPAEEEALLRGVLSDPQLRAKHWVRMQEASQNELDRMDLLARISTGLPPVTLVHGIGDDVIPEDESVALSDALRCAGVPVRLLLTSAVQHGTPKPLWQQAVGLPAFLWTLSRFFDDASP